MRILFLGLLLASFGLSWLWLERPGPREYERIPVNLPRIADLRLLTEESLPAASPEKAETEESAANRRNDPPVAENAARNAGKRPGLDRNPAANMPVFPAMAEVMKEFLEKTASPSCVMLSGFATREQARHLLGELKSDLYLSAEIVGSVPSGPVLHWVLVPSRDSRTEGLALLRRLQSQSIDSYLVTEGEHANAISLGLFKTREAATRVLRERAKAGLEVRLTEYPVEAEETHLHISTSAPEIILTGLPEGISSTVKTGPCKALQ